MNKVVERLNKLTCLLIYLKNNNYYFNKLLPSNISIYNVEEIYNKLPIIYKKNILDNTINYFDKSFTKLFMSTKSLYDSLFNMNNIDKNYSQTLFMDNKKWHVEYTTGTTGKPFPIVKSPKEIMRDSSYLLKCRKSIYFNANIKNGFLLAHEVDPVLRTAEFFKENYNFNKIIDYYIYMNPCWMFVTANTIKRFLKSVVKYEREEDISKVPLKFIEVTGAKLNANYKNKVEHIFNAKTYSQYGCREVWNIAYECEYGNLHINEENLIVDIVDENDQIITESGKEGEVIITNLNNKITPFVKYYLGDYAKIKYDKCPCGRCTRIIELTGKRRAYKLKHTDYFGDDIFRRVLRAIYIGYNITYDKIRIVQDKDYHISVYVLGCSDISRFKERFISISNEIIDEFNKFSVSFIEKYDFDQRQDFLKETTFISLVNN